jgi:hypothetical protein
MKLSSDVLVSISVLSNSFSKKTEDRHTLSAELGWANLQAWNAWKNTNVIPVSLLFLYRGGIGHMWVAVFIFGSPKILVREISAAMLSLVSVFLSFNKVWVRSLLPAYLLLINILILTIIFYI